MIEESAEEVLSSARLPNMNTTQRPSPLACIECRKKHLKCDATTPVCTRCKDRGLHCSYTPSRRGCGGRARRQGPSTQASSAPPQQQPFSTPLPPTPAYDPTESLSRIRTSSPDPSSWNHTNTASRAESIDPSSQQVSTPGSATSSKSSLRSEDEHLTNLYYSNFHPSHPMLVPRSRFSTQNYPDYLRTIVRFVGSHYAPNISSDAYRSSTTNLMSEWGGEKSPEMVQALVLYAMALHARYEPAEAMTAITKAADMAIGLGMNRAEYAEAHGCRDAVLEESLRRTWWELYVADGYLASLHRHTTFRTNSVLSTAYLPCEEISYANGLVSTERVSMDQFDNRHFADEDWQFSSFCYRIDAIRIMARVMAVSTANETHADAIQAIDNAVAAWKFNLPNEKAGIVDYTGEVDQMMFQAFLYIQCASIFLHFPRSELPISMPAAAEIQCAQRHMAQVSPTSTQHAAKALAASKDLANLASLPMDKYSPFFICGLVFACVVQLSACSAYPRGSTEQNRDRVALLIGLLKSLSRHWSIAQYVSQQLRKAANEIFNPKPEAASTSHSSGSTYDSGIDVTSFPTDMSWFDLFYNDGMQGVQVQPMELSGL